MKTALSLILILSIVFISCGQQKNNTVNQVIASKNGYELTEQQLAAYIKALEGYDIQVDDVQSQTIIKAELKKLFLENPQGITKDLNLLTGNVTISNSALPSSTPNNIALAEGHTIVRNKLGDNIGQMQFDTQAANNFRTYLTNSLLTATSSNINDGVNGSGNINSKNQLQFCANGTYVEAQYAQVIIDVPDASAYDADTTYIRGYWEVASLPNEKVILILYSTNPLILEDFSNGFIPWLVPKYGVDFIAAPNGDLYKREANHFCY